MDPITLRLPTDLLDELDEEAEEMGYSSRSEYIRHLLQSRDRATTGILSDTEQATSDTEDWEQVAELSQQVTELEERLGSLEDEVDNLRSEASDGCSSSEPAERAEPRDSAESSTGDVTAGLERWLEEEGPQSESARLIMLEAARILKQEGPLGASELRKRLYEQHPDAYSSAGTLWSSTIERFYKEAPGFEKPEYGAYGFEREDLEE